MNRDNEQHDRAMSIIDRCTSPKITSMITFDGDNEGPVIIAAFNFNSEQYKAIIDVRSEVTTIEPVDATEHNQFTELGKVSFNTFIDYLDSAKHCPNIFNS